MGSSCWMQESRSGGFEWTSARITRIHSTDEPLHVKEMLFVIARKVRKGCVSWVASKKRLEWNREVIVNHVYPGSREIIKWIAWFRAQWRVCTFFKLTQPPQVRTNKGRVTSNTKTSLSRQLCSWGAAHDLDQQESWSQISWLCSLFCLSAESALPHPAPAPALSLPVPGNFEATLGPAFLLVWLERGSSCWLWGPHRWP